MTRSSSIWSVIAFMLAGGVGLALAATRAPHGIRYDEIPDGAYAIVAEVHAQPGKERLLREATLPLVAKVRAEPNNLLYFFQESRDVSGHFFFYEIFVSKADFDAHNATPHVQAWFAKLPSLADGGVKVVRMEVLGNRSSETR